MLTFEHKNLSKTYLKRTFFIATSKIVGQVGHFVLDMILG